MTNQLVLKLAESPEEIQFLYDTRTHPEVNSSLYGSPPANFEQHRNYLAKVQGISRWIYVAYSHSQEKIGYSQIYDVKESQLEVGFAIHPLFQGKGYGSEIVSATVAQAKKEFRNRKIILSVLTTNHRAIHIYKKLGFCERTVQESSLLMELS
jgi:RimJ/RimL family protein N-acetyltransferase